MQTAAAYLRAAGGLVIVDEVQTGFGRIANLMRDLGVLISTDGPYDNVLKIKPPMAFGLQEAAIMADAMQDALRRL